MVATQGDIPIITAVLRDNTTQKDAKSPEDKFTEMRRRSPARLHELLTDNWDIFVPVPETGKGHGVVAEIHTEEDRTVYTNQFPLPHRHLEELKKMLLELQEKGWVEKAHSPYNNPIFLVPKPNGKWRIVLDFRGLNAIRV